MKKRFAIILTAALLLCTFMPLCLACSGTKSTPATLIPGIGFQWDTVEPDANRNASNSSGMQNPQCFSRLSSVIDSASHAAAAIRRIFSCRKADGGMFTFTVYGKGHGVGMSQLGSIEYARQGWSYDQILLHYYPGVSMEKEHPIPLMIYNGAGRETEDFLVRAVQQEMGADAASPEAYKAQAVAIYTMLKQKKFKLTSGDVACSTVKNSELSDTVRSAVKSVLGQYMACEGEAVNAAFFASSAGKTTDSQSVWGESLPYLKGGVESPETVRVSASTVTAKELKSMVRRYNATHPGKTITLSGDPSQWLEILTHDGARGDVGYVSGIRVGNMTMSGNAFRTVYNQYRPRGTAALQSHCFSVQYS